MHFIENLITIYKLLFRAVVFNLFDTQSTFFFTIHFLQPMSVLFDIKSNKKKKSKFDAITHYIVGTSNVFFLI